MVTTTLTRQSHPGEQCNMGHGRHLIYQQDPFPVWTINGRNTANSRRERPKYLAAAGNRAVSALVTTNTGI